MWNILCSITMGLAHLERSEQGHGCVSLLDMLVGEDGTVRICNTMITSADPSTFQ